MRRARGTAVAIKLLAQHDASPALVGSIVARTQSLSDFINGIGHYATTRDTAKMSAHRPRAKKQKNRTAETG
jgi:hypothetical protein